QAQLAGSASAQPTGGRFASERGSPTLTVRLEHGHGSVRIAVTRWPKFVYALVGVLMPAESRPVVLDLAKRLQAQAHFEEQGTGGSFGFRLASGRLALSVPRQRAAAASASPAPAAPGGSEDDDEEEADEGDEDDEQRGRST